MSQREDAKSQYSDHLTPEILAAEDQRRPLLVKSHRPDEELLAFLRQAGARVIVTVRDPLDCVVSYMRQFGASFDEAAGKVAASAESAVALGCEFPICLLRYEDGFVTRGETVLRIARFIGASCTTGTLIETHRGLRREAVIERIDALAAAGVIDAARPMDSYDAATHWHPNHVGDGAVGKYLGVLSAAQVAAVEARTAEFESWFYQPPRAARRVGARG